MKSVILSILFAGIFALVNAQTLPVIPSKQAPSNNKQTAGVKQTAVKQKPLKSSPAKVYEEDSWGIDQLLDYIKIQLFLHNSQPVVATKNNRGNVNQDFGYDRETTVIALTYADQSKCAFYLKKLDANYITWDIFDPNLEGDFINKILRMTIPGISGELCRACFDSDGTPNTKIDMHVARFLFDITTIEDVESFKKKMERVVARLIKLTGGRPKIN